MTPEQAKALREPFAPALIGKLPRVYCGDCRNARFKVCDKHSRVKCRDCNGNLTNAHLHLDYVGHAEITDRLLSVDPEWAWEPVAFDDSGLPKVDQHGGLWIRLSIAGVTRLGYGHADGKTGPDAVKESIGDSLRNAAMRFGVALDLWGAKFKEPDEAETTPDQPSARPAQRPSQASNSAPAPAAEPRPAPEPTSVRDWALASDRTADGIRKAAAKLMTEHPAVAATSITNEHGDDEQLSVFLSRRARELEPAATKTDDEAQEGKRRKRMFALFRELRFDGDANREKRHEIASKVLGRQITSMTNVTGADQEQVIKALEDRQRALRQQQGQVAA